MPSDSDLITVPRALIAVLVVVAVFTILVHPAFDGLPGTNPHSNHHALTFASVFLSLGFTACAVNEKLAAFIQAPLHGVDLLTLQCTLLC